MRSMATESSPTSTNSAPAMATNSKTSFSPIYSLSDICNLVKDDVCVKTEKGIKHCKLIAVHAGLEKEKGVEEQLKYLKAKDTRVPKVEPLSGRKSVWDIPKELTENPTVVVSGHHGKLYIDGLRLIIDEGGGMENNPVAAIVLPSMKIVRDTDDLGNQF